MLSIVIPTFNEAKSLPLLLADLIYCPEEIEIYICDAGSKDLTSAIANLYGVRIVSITEANRGKQLHNGANNTNNEWILFLHADSRLCRNWFRNINNVIQEKNNMCCYFFDFKVSVKGFQFRLLELAVEIRSKLFNKPYGDQGLLIKRSLYQEINGYNEIEIMEDIDLIDRLLNKGVRVKSLNTKIKTSGRAWKDTNIISKGIKNALLRRRWYKGESSLKLRKDYYNNKDK